LLADIVITTALGSVLGEVRVPTARLFFVVDRREQCSAASALSTGFTGVSIAMLAAVELVVRARAGLTNSLSTADEFI
jgi:hypothetical protein